MNSPPYLGPAAELRAQCEVVRCLSSGTSSAVFLCLHPDHGGELVAIKVLLPEAGDYEQALSRFHHEVAAGLRISHPNVVRIHSYLHHPRLLGYVMEYVDGGNLAGGLGDGEPLPVAQVVELLYEIALGLSAIHAAGVVHRDLRPENILITAEGAVKVADFGSAYLSHKTRLTIGGTKEETVAYLSPEYLEHGTVDARSDLYALGVIGYQLLTGRMPHEAGSSLIATIRRQVESDPRPPREVCPACPEALSNLILRAMHRKPNSRFTQAVEVASALEKMRIPRPNMAAPLRRAGGM